MSRFQTLLKCAPLLLIVALSGCISKVDLDATASTGANIEYAYVTVSEVWFHTRADAAATDSGWEGKVLDTPVTIDLAQLNNGSLSTLLSGLSLPAGTYHQLRLVMADNASSLLSSAQELSLSSNSEVQYLNSDGSLVTVPLEMASANGVLQLPVTIKVSGPSSGAVVSSQVSGSSSSTTSNAMTVTSSIALDMNALRGLTIFDASGQAGALFTPRLSAFNQDEVGSITGSLDLSAVTYADRTSAQSVIVTAETLSGDGSHFVEATSVALSSSGSFTLYPLPVPDSETAYYDLVIHGPGVQTMVIASVPVTAGDTTTVQSDSISVSVSGAYPVNTSTDDNGVPRGTQVDFYQTLPATSLPYLIESATINPFTGAFSDDIQLSAGTVIYGTYTDGDDIVFATVTPNEGSGKYLLSTRAVLHDPSTVGAKTISSSSTDTTVDLTLPTMTASAGAVTTTLNGTVTLGTLNYYNQGYVIVTHGGQVLDAVSIADALPTTGSSGSASFSFSNIPSGTSDAVYEVSVRLWNSSDPAGTLVRAGLGSLLDLRSATVDQINIDVP